MERSNSEFTDIRPGDFIVIQDLNTKRMGLVIMSQSKHRSDHFIIDSIQMIVLMRKIGLKTIKMYSAYTLQTQQNSTGRESYYSVQDISSFNDTSIFDDLCDDYWKIINLKILKGPNEIINSNSAIKLR